MDGGHPPFLPSEPAALMSVLSLSSNVLLPLSEHLVSQVRLLVKEQVIWRKSAELAGQPGPCWHLLLTPV